LIQFNKIVDHLLVAYFLGHPEYFANIHLEKNSEDSMGGLNPLTPPLGTLVRCTFILFPETL